MSDEIERIRADLERTGGRPVVSEAIRFATQDMPILLEALEALDRLVAREARVRALVEKWRALRRNGAQLPEKQQCANDLEAALSDPEVK